MGQSFKYTEPTIWALRKNAKQVRDATHSLYEHLYGYDPIRVVSRTPEVMVDDDGETIRQGSAANPGLNILNPRTNFIAVKLASDDPSNA